HGHQVRRGVAPDLQVVVDGELEEAARQARVGVPTRREVEQRPAHVVLLGAQGHVLARLHAPEALVAPPARQLPGQPGVRELADGQRAVLHQADEHGAGGYSRVAAASRLIESGSCVGRYTTGSERTRAWMRPVVSR